MGRHRHDLLTYSPLYDLVNTVYIFQPIDLVFRFCHLFHRIVQSILHFPFSRERQTMVA